VVGGRVLLTLGFRAGGAGVVGGSRRGAWWFSTARDRGLTLGRATLPRELPLWRPRAVPGLTAVRVADLLPSGSGFRPSWPLCESCGGPVGSGSQNISQGRLRPLSG
jgi:hypothetical protein